MKYAAIYEQLISRARTRAQINGYTEKHHVVPKCLGGMDDADNIVSLTAREHYIAHQLLVKLYPNNRQLVYAAYAMTWHSKTKGRVGNRLYGWLKERLSEARKNQPPMSGITRELLRKANLGKVLSEDTKAKLRAANTGKLLSEEHKKAIGLKSKGRTLPPSAIDKLRTANLGKKHSPETIAKMKASLKGRVVSEETREKLRAAWR